MKKLFVVVAAVFCAVFVAAGVAMHAQEVRLNAVSGVTVVTMPVESRTLKGAPYSAEIANDSTQTLADGNRIVEHSTGRVYRDSQGRVRREEDRPSGTPAVSIIDPVAGVSYSLDAENHIAWKSPAPVSEEIMKKVATMREHIDATMQQQRAVTIRRAQASEQTAAADSPDSEELKARRAAEEAGKRADEMKVKTMTGRVGWAFDSGDSEDHRQEPLAPRQMEGVRVEGHRTTTTIAAGAIGNELPIVIVSEEWSSPELQVLVMTQRKDPRNGDSTYRLLNIVPRDPDASLFQVPSDYVVKETGIRRLEPSRQER